MKEIYSFDVSREIEKEVPHVKKTKNGPVETTKRVKKKIKNRLVFCKPNISDLEDADFFYGQKYNEFINAGFLTRAMLAKKMGDIGGMTSKKTEDVMGELISENAECARTIEFFGGADNLDDEQKEQLKEAKERYANTSRAIQTMETDLRSQFNQTADAKAEQKLIEWFVLHFAFYEDEVDDGEKSLFSLFEGENYTERRNSLMALQGDIEEIKDSVLLKLKNIFDGSYTTFIRVASIWYNKIAEDQDSIEKALKDIFEIEKAEEDEEGQSSDS